MIKCQMVLWLYCFSSGWTTSFFFFTLTSVYFFYSIFLSFIYHVFAIPNWIIGSSSPDMAYSKVRIGPLWLTSPGWKRPISFVSFLHQALNVPSVQLIHPFTTRHRESSFSLAQEAFFNVFSYCRVPPPTWNFPISLFTVTIVLSSFQCDSHFLTYLV